MHNEVNVSENIVTPTGDIELHTRFAIFKSNSPESVLYDKKYHQCNVYTAYRTQKIRLDKEEKRLCVRKATHKCIIKVDVHSSMYAWHNIKKHESVSSLIRMVSANTFILNNNVSDYDLVDVFTNIAKENNLNVINTLNDINPV